MVHRILVIDDSCDIIALCQANLSNFQTIICLFWASPETLQQIREKSSAVCYSLEDIIGGLERWERDACKRTELFSTGGPRYLDLPVRMFLAELLYQECLTLQVALDTVGYIESLRQEHAYDSFQVDYALSPQIENFFKVAVYSSAADLKWQSNMEYSEKLSLKAFPFSLTQRLGRRYQEICVTGGWRTHAWHILAELDPEYRIRSRWERLKGSTNISRGGVGFFSSYLNNSRILHGLEEDVPSSIHWILTNDSARRGATESTHEKFWLWQFSSSRYQKTDWPKRDSFPVSSLPSGEDAILERWLSHSPVWRNWQNGSLLKQRTLTQYWEAYLDEARPHMVVMANQWGIDGWFMQLCRRHGIPVLQFMHGALGGHLYTQTSILSNLLLVPGEFWRLLWPAEERRKICVYNPPGYINAIEKQPWSKKKRVTLFSWPILGSPFYSFAELTDGFINIFHKLLSRGDFEVTVRAHPSENPLDFVNRWRTLYGSIPDGLRLSKHEPLDQVLSHTDLALMYRSTVMLNCLASGIPVIMPGWMNFGWNNALVDVPGIYVARGFSDLNVKMMEWLDYPPKMGGEVTDHFVRPAGEGKDEFTSLIRDLCRSAC